MIDLKARREELGLSQEEVANKIDVTRGTVSKWEKGDITNMKRDKIASLANVLKINPLILLGLKPEKFESKTSYNFFDAAISAGSLQTVDPFTSNQVQTITIPDALLGKYAGDKDIFISRINGESMNRCIPDESIIAIKKFSSLYELKDGDIVVFQDASEMSIKRFYNDQKNKIISFIPDSSNKDFRPILYRYEDIQQINILGKVVMYTVEL